MDDRTEFSQSLRDLHINSHWREEVRSMRMSKPMEVLGSKLRNSSVSAAVGKKSLVVRQG